MIVPTDVLTALCVELAKASDALLAAARGVAVQEARGTEFGPDLLAALMAVNAHIGAMEGILKAIIDENPAPRRQSGNERYNA
jgi:hypothetical protein